MGLRRECKAVKGWEKININAADVFGRAFAELAGRHAERENRKAG